MHTQPPIQRIRKARARAFTLLEALAASAVLALVVLAVGAAVSAGQVATLNGTTTVLASMAADDLMNEIVAVPYSQLVTYDNLNQPSGAITTLTGTPYPQAYYAIGRSVEAYIDIIDDPETGTRVRGTVIRVTATTGTQSNIIIETFLAEPPTS